VFCEFLEVAVHQILFARAVYPAELFERKRYGPPARPSACGPPCACHCQAKPRRPLPALTVLRPGGLPLRRRKYNVPVRQSRHKELNDYIANAGPVVLRPWLRAICAGCLQHGNLCSCGCQEVDGARRRGKSGRVHRICRGPVLLRKLSKALRLWRQQPLIPTSVCPFPTLKQIPNPRFNSSACPLAFAPADAAADRAFRL
jgi:hypothetical protein